MQNTERVTVCGIDVGSILTKAAVVDKGSVHIVLNEASNRQTPSILSFTAKQRLSSETAQSKLKSNAAHTIISPTKCLAFSASPYIQRQSLYHPTAIQHPQITMLSYTPQQLTAGIFTTIKQQLTDSQFTARNTVIAIPDYASHSEISAMRDAARIARIPNAAVCKESSAVAMEYGFYRREDKTVLFIDFGHSKLSIYAIEFHKDWARLIYSHSIRQLGCRDMDHSLLQYYKGILNMPTLSLPHRMKLLQAIQKQRKTLSGNNQYDLLVENIPQNEDFNYSMTRQQYVQVISPVLQEISLNLNQSKDQLLRMQRKIDSIELIGGGTRIPSVIQLVEDIFKMRTSRTLNSTQCIANGCALIGAMRSEIVRMQQYVVVEQAVYRTVCKWYNGTGQGEVEVLHQGEQLLSKEITVPCAQRIVVQEEGVVQGINGVVCQILLKLPTAVRIRFGANGEIQYVRQNQDKEVEYTIQEERISEECIGKMAQIEEQIWKRNLEVRKEQEIRNQLESWLFKLRNQLREKMEQEIGKYICPEKAENLLRKLNQIEERIYNHQKQDVRTKQVENEYQNLRKAAVERENQHRRWEDQIKSVEEWMMKCRNQYGQLQQINKLEKWIGQIKQIANNSPKWQILIKGVEQIRKVQKEVENKIKIEIQAKYKYQNRRNYQPRQYESMYPNTQFKTQFKPYPNLRSRNNQFLNTSMKQQPNPRSNKPKSFFNFPSWF